MAQRFEQLIAGSKPRDRSAADHYAAGVTDTFDMLLFGATGPVGRALRARAALAGLRLALVSRHRHADSDTERWFQHDLYHEGGETLPAVRVVFSAGPLDGITRWSERERQPAGTRIVALSSTSALVKQASPDPRERDLARTLLDCEQRMLALGEVRSCPVTLLRPTLIYGNGPDRSLSRLVGVCRRIGGVPLPASALGIRQPVHADDLAAAMLACTDRADLAGAVLTLPGAERLSYRDMVQRQLDVSTPGRRVWSIPDGLIRIAVGVLSLAPGPARTLATQVGRMSQDLAFNDSDWRKLGISPRRFEPE